MDPLTEKYYSISPYVYCGNNPMRFIDPDGMDVYLLFYTQGNRNGDNMFEQAAQTRKEAIESRKNFNSERDKVLMIGVKDISEIGSMTEWAVDTYSEQYGQTAEVGVWSHAGYDGPVGTKKVGEKPLYEGSTQMSLEGWGSIDFNWKERGASMNFYGCNTANEEVVSFAQNVSNLDNMKNVDVFGQSTYSYPSGSAYSRTTSLSRQFGIYIGNTYLVGGESGKAVQSYWFYPSTTRLKAYPMNVYQNGKRIKQDYQKTF